MARFLLQPCKLRLDRLIPLKDTDPVEMTWGELSEKFAPSREARAFRSLSYLETGAYVGLLKHPRNPSGPPVNFVFVGQDRSGVIASLLVRDPGFADRILEVYRVLEADRGAATKEAAGIVRRPIPMGATP